MNIKISSHTTTPNKQANKVFSIDKKIVGTILAKIIMINVTTVVVKKAFMIEILSVSINPILKTTPTGRTTIL